MSGIAGIVNRDGASVDPRLLRRMTESLLFRGPDAQAVWIQGRAGLAHTLLRTGPAEECQPLRLDTLSITADARLDGRAELLEQLTRQGRPDLAQASDAALILHAYQAWGEGAVEHLLGDFSFALWDDARQQLFCARDHFGVKPFFYARLNGCLIFSNTLNCLRTHPAVSDTLNDRAIADFLLFGKNQESATSAFADIQRLPAGHTLTWSAGAGKVQRYWSLTLDQRIRYRRSSDYIDRFNELMQASVRDRLRGDSAGVLMSGGLDSTTVAAVARQVTSHHSTPFRLRAVTAVYDRLMPDRERYYAGAAAAAVGIPIEYLAVDDHQLFQGSESPGCHTPEPGEEPLRSVRMEMFQQLGAHSRVALTGFGGDPALCPCRDVREMALGAGPLELALHLGRFLLSGRLPPVGVRTTLQRWRGIRPPEPRYPGWLNHDLEARLGLLERWGQRTREPEPIRHSRATAYRSLTHSFWAYLFEDHDAGFTSWPLEVAHPFFDVRVIHYVLAIPPVPWCLNKEMLRAATAGVLPEIIRRRPKTPLAADPVRVLLEQQRPFQVRFQPTPEVYEYVDRNAFTGDDVESRLLNLRPMCLSYWLKARHAPLT